MYHSHHDEMTQMALGLMGLFVIDPRNPKYRVDRDFAFLLSEWRIDTGTMRPNPNEMTDFNIFSLNARIFPGTEPIVAKLGDRVRIRLVNLSPMDHHPMHLHRHSFRVFATDGAGQFDYITMGGMFTVLKIRDGITSYEDPGWYHHPEGTVASLASADELRRNNIEIPAGQSPPETHHDHRHS